jgi:putative sterol carrier protein
MPDADALVAAMRQRSPALRGLGYRVRFDLTDTGESILLDGTGSQAEVAADAGDAEADTVLRLSSEDLGRLIAGRLSPMLAFSTGRLRVEGSKGVAMKLASLLDEE